MESKLTSPLDMTDGEPGLRCCWWPSHNHGKSQAVVKLTTEENTEELQRTGGALSELHAKPT